MVEYRKLEHQINMSGSHTGNFEECLECKRRKQEIEQQGHNKK